jgi:hypothetical protein
MADKEARVRLTLNNAGFLGGLRQTTDEVKRQGSVMAKAFHQPLLGGLNAAKKSLTNLGSEAKTAAKFGLALGGSFSLATAAKDALSLESKYKNMAFAIRAGTGEAVKWQDIQARIQTTALATHQANEDVAASFDSIREETGSLKFTEGAIGAVGRMATITGESMGLFADLAGTAFEKFGIRADETEEALSSIYSLANRGGLKLEEMAEKFSLLGSAGKIAGATGLAGMRRVLGMTSFAEEATGNKRQATAATAGMFEELSNPETAKRIGKALHINLLDKKGNVKATALDQILAKTGGEAQRIMPLAGGATQKVLVELGKVYKQGFEASDKKGKARTQDALDAFHAAVEKAAKSELDQIARDEQFRKKSEAPKAALTDALNELTNAFNKPEVTDAMKKLARLMPQLASGAAKLLDVAVNNPLLAGAGYLGVRGGLAGFGGFASEFGASLVKSGDPTGAAIAKAFGSSVSVSPAWALGGVAFAAAAGFGIGKLIADQTVGEDTKQMSDTENALALADAAVGPGDKEQQLAALKAAKERLKQVKENPASGFTEFVSDVASVATGGDVKTARQREADEITGLTRVIDELQQATGETGSTSDKANRALMSMASSAERVKRVFDSLDKGGGNGSNGPPPSPGNPPGYYTP